MNRKLLLLSAALLATAIQSIARADAPTTAPAQSQPASPWTPIPDSAFPAKTADDTKLNTISKGALVGIAVDSTTGDVYALLNNHGVWKSTDQAATFKEPTTPFKGRPISTFSLNVDPAGKRLAWFLEYGEGGITTDAGKTWKLVAPLAPNIGPRDYTYAWDPIHDIFYVAQMNKPALKCIITPDPSHIAPGLPGVTHPNP